MRGWRHSEHHAQQPQELEPWSNVGVPDLAKWEWTPLAKVPGHLGPTRPIAQRQSRGTEDQRPFLNLPGVSGSAYISFKILKDERRGTQR